MEPSVPSCSWDTGKNYRYVGRMGLSVQKKRSGGRVQVGLVSRFAAAQAKRKGESKRTGDTNNLDVLHRTTHEGRTPLAKPEHWELGGSVDFNLPADPSDVWGELDTWSNTRRRDPQVSYSVRGDARDHTHNLSRHWRWSATLFRGLPGLDMPVGGL